MVDNKKKKKTMNCEIRKNTTTSISFIESITIVVDCEILR